MKEKDLRKWHRTMGLFLALFVVVQAGTGLLITLSEMDISHSHGHEEFDSDRSEDNDWVPEGLFALLHHGGGAVGLVYRVLLGIGITGMALSGSVIYFKTRGRMKSKQSA